MPSASSSLATHRVGRPTNASLQVRPRVSLPMAINIWEEEISNGPTGPSNTRCEPIKAVNHHMKFAGKHYRPARR